MEVLEVIADMFKLTLDDLLRKDLSENKGSYIAKRRAQKLASGRADIPFVPVKAAAGYLAGYADPDFIDELNTFTLPMLSGGDYRAFEIIGDSMMPTPSGSVIVCDKVNSLEEVKSNNTYIVVSRTDGVVYKRMMKKQSREYVDDQVQVIILSQNHLVNSNPESPNYNPLWPTLLWPFGAWKH